MIQEVNLIPNPAAVNTLEFDFGWPCTEGFVSPQPYLDWLK
jgi:hypothetical protein